MLPGPGRTFTIGPLQVRINFLIALCVLMACTLFVNLGLWQLGRAAEKRQMQRENEQQQRVAPVPLSSLATSTTGAVHTDAPLNNRRVELQGEYLNDASFLLVFQFFNGLPGNEVITPMRQDDGTLVLVSRGWMAPGPGDAAIPDIPAVTGQQRVTGQLHVPVAATVAGQVEQREWPLRLRRMHVPQAEQLLGEPLYPWVVRLDPDAAGVLIRHWPAVTISTRSNIGYAMQWFGFALATLVISLLLCSNLLQLLRSGRQSHG